MGILDLDEPQLPSVQQFADQASGWYDRVQAAWDNENIRSNVFGTKDELIENKVRSVVDRTMGEGTYDKSGFRYQPGETGERTAYAFWAERFKAGAVLSPQRFGNAPQTSDDFYRIVNDGIREEVEGNNLVLAAAPDDAFAAEFTGSMLSGTFSEAGIVSMALGGFVGGSVKTLGATALAKIGVSEAILGAGGEALTLPAQFDAARRLGEADPNVAGQLGAAAGLSALLGVGGAVFGRGVKLGYGKVRGQAEMPPVNTNSPLGDIDQRATEAEIERAFVLGDTAALPDTSDQALELAQRGLSMGEPAPVKTFRPDPARPALEDPAVSNVLGYIGGLEAPEGFDQVYGGSRLQPPKSLSTMTVDEVLAWQDASVAAGSDSSAAGRFQIIRKTLRGLKDSMGLTGGEVFDEAMQTQMAVELMKGRGLEDWRAGRISNQEFGDRLAQEWASLPVLTGDARGRSYYAGDGLNASLTDADTFEGILGGADGGGKVVARGGKRAATGDGAGAGDIGDTAPNAPPDPTYRPDQDEFLPTMPKQVSVLLDAIKKDIGLAAPDPARPPLISAPAASDAPVIRATPEQPQAPAAGGGSDIGAALPKPETARPRTLTQFVMERGGLWKDDLRGELADIRRVGLVRAKRNDPTKGASSDLTRAQRKKVKEAIEKGQPIPEFDNARRSKTNGGLTVDEMRELAAEQGFLPMESDAGQFIDALRRDLGGDNVFAQSDLNAAAEWKAQDAATRPGRYLENPEDDFIAGNVETEAQTSFMVDPNLYEFSYGPDAMDQIDREVRAYAAETFGNIFSDSELAEVVAAVQSRGGDVFFLLENAAQRERDFYDANPKASPRDDIPFGDEPATAPEGVGRSAGDIGEPEINGGPATGGRADDSLLSGQLRPDGTLRPQDIDLPDPRTPDDPSLSLAAADDLLATIKREIGGFDFEQTDIGDQAVIPGAERSVDRSAQAQQARAQAEVAARQQQSKMRRGGQTRVEDDGFGLFAEREVTLFDMDTGIARDVTVRDAIAESDADMDFLEQLDLCGRR